MAIGLRRFVCVCQGQVGTITTLRHCQNILKRQFQKQPLETFAAVSMLSLTASHLEAQMGPEMWRTLLMPYTQLLQKNVASHALFCHLRQTPLCPIMQGRLLRLPLRALMRMDARMHDS